MKHKILFLLLALIAGASTYLLAQTGVVNETIVLPVDTLTVGQVTDYSNAGFEQTMDQLAVLLLGLVNMLLIVLSHFFPKLRNVKFVNLDNTRVRVWIVGGATALLGFFIKDGEGGWLNHILPTLGAIFTSTGLWELVFKNWFGKKDQDKTEG